MDPQYAAAVQYIHEQLARGVTEQQLREHFSQAGWPAESVETALRYSQLPPQTAPLAMASGQTPPLAQANPIIQPTITPPITQAYSTGQFTQEASATDPAPSKYKVFYSIKEVWLAISHNKLAYGASILAALVFYGAGIFLFALLAGHLATSSFISGHISTFATLIGLLVIVILVTTLLYSFVSSFVVYTSSHALADGHRDQRSPIIALLKDGLRNIIRVTWVGFVATLLMIAIPCVAFAVVIALDIIGRHNSVATISSLVIGLGTVVWVLVASLRLVLVQQVAVFEPQLSPITCLRRSSQLLRGGGQWFIVKGSMLIFAVYIVLSIINSSGLKNLDKTHNPFILAGLTIIALLGQGVLTMLYINRAAVRGQLSN